MPVPNDIELLAPWKLVCAEDARQLLSELQRELSHNHPLSGRKVEVCARRLDRDDILVLVEGLEKPLAVVHLTWCKEADPRWPRIALFASWQDWVKHEMLPAHQDRAAKS